MSRGFMIAAPSSGSGKTTVTLGLLRALRLSGVDVAPGKAGPDYIDPAFHAAASGMACLNFDPWAMRPELILANAGHHKADHHVLVVEAMMGLFDGAADGTGSAADLAALLGLSVVLVIDASRMAQSVAALVEGFSRHRSDVKIAGVILNKVGSARHEAMLRGALEKIDMPVLGALHNHKVKSMPERHLGLVQAHEHESLEGFITQAAQIVAQACDLEALLQIAGQPASAEPVAYPRILPPPGQRVAIARDIAFAFCYEHIVQGWRRNGAEISFFSPLANEMPDAHADSIYLPGGYPELHAETLAHALRFQAAMQSASEYGTRIYGECGGYMALGEGLIDKQGKLHRMLGLLPHVTSFAEPRRHLGYRRVTPVSGSFFAQPMTAHEFHYSTLASPGDGDPLFRVEDALGNDLGTAGHRRGSVEGSYLHMIDLDEKA